VEEEISSTTGKYRAALDILVENIKIVYTTEQITAKKYPKKVTCQRFKFKL
jgi:hypothetical protein